MRFTAQAMALSALIIAVVGAAANAALTASPAGGVDASARDAIKTVLAEPKSLRLSMGDDGAADRFRFILTLMIKKGNATVTTHYLIARDGEQMAAVVLSGGGDPYAYVRKGFMAGFDPKIPGQLLLVNEGGPRFTFDIDKHDGNLDVELSFLRSIKQPELKLDLNEFLRGAIEKAGRADYEPQRRIVRMATESSSMLVILPPAGAQGRFGVERVEIVGRGGTVIVLSGIILYGEPAQIFGIEKAAFEKAGLKMREVTATEPGKVPLFVPAFFGTDPKEQDAIQRMKTVLPPSALSSRPKTTQPTANKQ